MEVLQPNRGLTTASTHGMPQHETHSYLELHEKRKDDVDAVMTEWLKSSCVALHLKKEIWLYWNAGYFSFNKVTERCRSVGGLVMSRLTLPFSEKGEY